MAETHDEQPQSTWATLGLDKATFDELPPTDRTTLERTHNPQPPVRRRPLQDYKPSAEEQTELDAITNRDDRVTRYRQLRDQAAASQ